MSYIIKVIASDSNRNQKKPANLFAGYFIVADFHPGAGTGITLEKSQEISILLSFIFLQNKKMTTITTTVPFPVKEQHMDIKQLLKRYVDYVVKQDKSLNSLEIDFGKKWINAKDVLSYLKKIHD